MATSIALTLRRRVRFAHRSEARFARLLDFYRIRWEYEPHTFALREDESGAVREAFTPDFWLPEQGVYVELTVLRQQLVTKKNGKLRRFRERYPEMTLRMLYRRDVDALATKYV